MLIAFTGPSGIGKGFVKEKLLQSYSFIKELVWFTTRELRPNEQKSNRIVLLEEEFNDLVISNKLVLVQNDLFGHSYGISKDDLLPNSCVNLTEIHIDNVKQALEINPDILLIGFITHDFSILRSRLSLIRKTESSMEIEKRIFSAQIEVEIILSNKNLFTSIIEVNKYTENMISEKVMTILANNFKKMEEELWF